MLKSVIKIRYFAGQLLLMGITSAFVLQPAAGQEAITSEVRVDGSFTAWHFELRRDKAVQILTDRLTSRAAELRSAELQRADESIVTRLLELTKYSPFRFGNDPRVDTFFLSNSMRPDLNPRNDNRLFLTK